MFASSVPQAVALRVREMGVLLFRVVDTSKDLVESIAPDASSKKWRLSGERQPPIWCFMRCKKFVWSETTPWAWCPLAMIRGAGVWGRDVASR